MRRITRAAIAKKWARLPLHPIHLDQPQVSLVHQGGRLQRVSAPLFRHVPAGDLAQFVVHQRQERLECRPIALAPGQKQRRWVLLDGRDGAIVAPGPWLHTPSTRR
jgi:hypothetical protein